MQTDQKQRRVAKINNLSEEKQRRVAKKIRLAKIANTAQAAEGRLLRRAQVTAETITKVGGRRKL